MLIESDDLFDGTTSREVAKKHCVRSSDCRSSLPSMMLAERVDILDEDSRSEAPPHLCKKRCDCIYSEKGLMSDEFLDEASFREVSKRICINRSDGFSSGNSHFVRLAIARGAEIWEPHLLVILGAYQARLLEDVSLCIIWTATESEAAELLFDGQVEVACGGYSQLLQHWSCGWRSKILCSPTCTTQTQNDLICETQAVVFCSEAFEFLHPDLCLCIVRGIIRAARRLHDDPQFFFQVVSYVACNSSTASCQNLELLDLWRQFVESGVFAVNGAISRAHWGPRLEKASTCAAVGYEELVAFAHVNAALRKLGRHPSRFDEI